MRLSFIAITFLLLTSCASIDKNKNWNLHKTAGYNYKFLLCKNYQINSLEDFKDYTGRGLPITLLNKCVIKVCKTETTCTFHGKSRLKRELLEVSTPNIITL